MERAHFERSCIRSSIPTICRYTDLHMPLVEKTPGIDRLKATRVVDAIDGNMPPYHRICEFWFGILRWVAGDTGIAGETSGG